MLEIRIANQTDLDNIANLYIRNTIKSSCKYKPEPKINYQNKIQQYKDNVLRDLYIDNKIYVAYNKDIFIGFFFLEPDPYICDCMCAHNLTIANYIVERNIINLHFLYKAIDEAMKNGYKKLSIESNERNQLRELCISLGAKSYVFQGMMYSYYEKLLFEDISSIV